MSFITFFISFIKLLLDLMTVRNALQAELLFLYSIGSYLFFRVAYFEILVLII